MKSLCAIFLIFACCAVAAAQATDNPCPVGDCDCLHRKAEAARKLQHFRTAVEKYQALAVCDPARKTWADQQVVAVFDEVEALRQQADKANKSAQTEKKRAEKALSDLRATLTDVVRLNMREADELIRLLRYDEALEKCLAAAKTKAGADLILPRVCEIAFVHTETNQCTRAARALDSFRIAYPDTTRTGLLSALRRLNPAHYDSLQRRYYPDMVLVPGDAFRMGCDSVRDCVEDNDEGKCECPPDETLHEVTLDSFRMARTETTVWQYYLYARSTGADMEKPSWGLQGDHPVVNINWYDALRYANWLSERRQQLPVAYNPEGETNDKIWPKGLKTRGFRLPTEAEWEYAARGGPQSRSYRYAGGNEVDSVAWYGTNSDGHTQPTGRKWANELGLHDMSGNVCEWCWDWYGDYPEGAAVNPVGPPESVYSRRVLRGGGWDDDAGNCRSAYRSHYLPDYRYLYNGFRLVCLP